MGKATEYEAKAEKLITPIIEANGFELVDLEYVKEGSNFFLRAYIDKPGGITIDDCELVSRAFSDELDKDDFIEDAYVLEISSPGLGRQLKKEKDFVRYQGEEVEIKLFKAIAKEQAAEAGEKATGDSGQTAEAGRQTATDGEQAAEAGTQAASKKSKSKKPEQLKEFTGILAAHDEKTVTIEVDGRPFTIERTNLAMIRLAVNF